jgi:hypothetical protein
MSGIVSQDVHGLPISSGTPMYKQGLISRLQNHDLHFETGPQWMGYIVLAKYRWKQNVTEDVFNNEKLTSTDMKINQSQNIK